MRRRIFAFLLIVTAVSTILVVVPSQPAFADDCQTEHAIFWGDYSTTDWKWDTHGTRDSIRLSNRSLDGLCPTNIDLAWSTTHMTLNNVPYEQIELGWAEQSIGSGETAYYWFTEWQQGNSFPHRVEKLFNSSTGACNPTLGGYVLMKVNNYPLGTTNWTFDVSCDGGSTWHTVDTLTNVLDATGNPQVETGKKGDTTGASDDHQSLQWKDANGNYSRWNAAHCWSDSIDSPTNWKGNVYSTSPFDWQTLSNGQGTEC